jgi:2-amino-4-hydroxy-6-hydroxymethyldihydropteridine diphosphokinase
LARVFLSIGSNLGERRQNLQAAIQRLRAAEGIRLLEVSRLYETEPWECLPGQIGKRGGWFLNCVVAVETGLAPPRLLSATQEIEAALGRVRSGIPQEAGRYEPRTLDIDILLYGDEVFSASDDLHIPHLLLHERGFVLRPLADLAPELEHPVLYQTVRELLEGLEDDHQVVPADLPSAWW